jgi:multidrug transporter EmrE-like cation transporter
LLKLLMVSNMLSEKWNSEMNKIRYFSFIIVSIVFQSLGGIFGKYAALSLHVPTFIGIVTNVFYIISVGCLFLQAVVWQQALRHYPLSVAYPCISITNFVVLFAATILFRETVTYANMIGLILVTTGIFMLFHFSEESR